MRGPRGRAGARAWAAADIARQVAERFRTDWKEVPPRARRVWARTLLLGFVLALGWTVGLVSLVRALERAGLLSWERSALLGLEEWSPISFDYGVVVQEIAGPFLLIILIIFSALFAVWLHHPLRALTLLAAFFGVDPAILLGWALWNRARPTIIEQGIAAPGGLNAFPSGHVTQAVAVYGVVLFLWAREATHGAERALVALLFVGFMSAAILGRLRIGAHWPTDVAAGLLIGGLWVAVLATALHQAERIARCDGAPH